MDAVVVLKPLAIRLRSWLHCGRMAEKTLKIMELHVSRITDPVGVGQDHPRRLNRTVEAREWARAMATPGQRLWTVQNGRV